MNGKISILAIFTAILCGTASAANELVRFAEPWTSPYRVDPQRPFQLVNAEGRHLFIVNKTAWLYFGCKNPEAVLDRAVEQGVNVLRVALEGRLYYETVGIELWPWSGTRANPVVVAVQRILLGRGGAADSHGRRARHRP